MLRSFAEWVVVSWGWPRRLTALLAGASGALALAPFGFLPALVISMTIAVWLIDGCAAGRTRMGALRGAMSIGWWFGFGYFLAGLWWLGAAFLVEADRFAWALPLGVVALPAGLGLFHALAFGLARMVWSAGAGRILALAAAFGITEWLRGVILTGFPWNIYGMALAEHLWLAQVASIIGVNGLTVLAVAICAAPATLAADRATGRWRPTVVAAGLLIALAVFGAWRIPAAPTPFVADVRLRIMQPNLPQDDKFRAENRDAIMRRYLSVSDRATSPTSMGVADATHLIWPESAFPFILSRDATALAQIAGLLPPGVTLITGAARIVEPLPGESGSRYRNAIQVVGDDGTILSSYDKVHLVPFGEYLPFTAQLNALGIRQFVAIPGGFEPGSTRSALNVPGLPLVAPLICYEAIFPQEVVPQGPRPGVFLNVTNDAWFGNTPGPRQHYAQARLRSVEQGIPLVRAANSGISAVVDPYGRAIATLPVGRDGVIDSGLPMVLPPTIYTRYGDVLFLGLVLACVSGAVMMRWRQK